MAKAPPAVTPRRGQREDASMLNPAALREVVWRRRLKGGRLRGNRLC